MGFSQKMTFPAALARSIKPAWVSLGDAISTASMPGSAKTASALATRAPKRPASRSAAAGISSTTATNSLSGWATTSSAWIVPILPAPNSATLTLTRAPQSSPPSQPVFRRPGLPHRAHILPPAGLPGAEHSVLDFDDLERVGEVGPGRLTARHRGEELVRLDHLQLLVADAVGGP